MINNCPYCKAEKFSLVTNEIRDSETSIIRRCMSCGLVFLDSNEGFISNIEQYYNENYTVDNSLIKEERYDIFANNNYINNDSCKNRNRLIFKVLR